MSNKSDPAPFAPVKPHPSVISRRLGDDIVLFHLDSDRFYELNGTAARFWELLNSEKSTSQICDQMLEEFAVEREELASEADALIASLRQEDLVTSNE